ncbi:hypothetical protein GGS21DRAFT_361514 [Xylaria nigripes]|nr:hypothetical protein GGS21DRAFT_361514 [Xylaria nigripes]
MATEDEAQVADNTPPQPSVEDVASSSETPASPPPPQVNVQEGIAFLNLLTSIAADPSTAWIRQLIRDNECLKAASKKQMDESNGFMMALAKLSQDLQQEIEKSQRAVSESESSKAKATELANAVDDANKKMAEKDQELENNVTTINGLKTDVENLDKEVKARDEEAKKHEEKQAQDSVCISELVEELGTTKAKLGTAADQLKELEELSWKMGEMSKDEVLDEINKIYNEAKAIATKYLGQELPNDVLQDTELFADIYNLAKPIPLFASNTIAARKTRVAAFLHVLGSRLVARIFVPFYYQVPQPGDDFAIFQQDGMDMSFVLSSLSEEDPKRELHLRSVLLASSCEKQKALAVKRAADVAAGIVEYFGELLKTEVRNDFEAEITKLCNDAVVSWEKLRVLKVKIEPFTEAEDHQKYWLPAELDIGIQNRPQSPNPDGVPKKQLLNGRTSSLASKPSLHSLTTASRVTLVWPGFCYGQDVLKQGYMLLDSQVKQAIEEANSKRAHRAAVRANTPQMHRRATGRRLKPVAAGGSE